jgi:hypothetical protein
MALIISTCVRAEEPLPEASHSTIGFKTAEAALKAVKAESGVVETEQNGWAIFADYAHHTIWSFAPVGHPAYPTAVKREFVERDGSISVEMGIQCEASKPACDDVVQAFDALNQELKRSAESRHIGSGQ